MNPLSYYFKINYFEPWYDICKYLAKANGLKPEDIPPEILAKEDAWTGETLRQKNGIRLS